jgi:hypothetical protein
MPWRVTQSHPISGLPLKVYGARMTDFGLLGGDMSLSKCGLMFALLVCSQLSMADQRVIVIGDSISEHIYCWPNELRLENPQLNLQLMTQSGRTIRDFAVPRDLRNVSKKDVVIYFLGTNDAYGSYPMRYVNEAFVSHMVFLQERGFRVIVLLPPGSSRLMPKIEHVRTVITMQSLRLGVEYYDLQFWDESMTKDGVHPGPELSRLVAEFVYSLLALDLHAGLVIIKSELECSPDGATGAIG